MVQIAILAGGRSTRFGSDKAMARIGEETFLELITRAAVETGCPVLIVGRSGDATNRVRFVTDEMPDRGPLGGLATALTAADGDDVLLCGCDMPLLTKTAFNWLLSQPRQPEASGIVVSVESKLQPLFGIYGAGCEAEVRRRIEANQLSMLGFIESGHLQTIVAPPWLERQLANINTPEEWNVIAPNS